jgi:serine/threonine protein kinase
MSIVGTVLGHYEITSRLDKGGMGEVYRAKDTKLGREVAIKVLPEEFAKDADRVARFQREAKLLASLNNPNIAAIYGLEESSGTNFLVLELVEGETLGERSAGVSPAAVEDILKIALQIAEALEAAHDKGLIHRDLKPANIKVTPDGKVKVLDFGLANAFAGEQAEASMSNSPTLSIAATQQGVILGTAGYMSPEQARGRTVDKRADIWAFGVILYEMLTGKRLFEGDTVSDTLAAVLKEEPDWDRVPPETRPLLHRCLEKDPKRRLRDIADAMPLIEDVPESKPAKRPLLAWSVAAIFAIATAAVSLLHFYQKGPATPESVRFEIQPRATLDWSSPFAISPDGRHLAFAAYGADAVVRLWVRDLDSLQARPISGTESTHIPPFFWSPDSRFIAFGSEKKLKKADITGGGTLTICDVDGDAVTGAWSPEGVIIFGGQQGLWRVSASGGLPAPLTKPDRTLKVNGLHFPVFLPDGRHFLYFLRSESPEYRGTYIGSLDSKPEGQPSKPLLAETYGNGYVPSQDSGPGQILFMRDQTLFSQRFDEKRLETVGQPVPIVEHVGTYQGLGLFSASTNGVLAYLESGTGSESQFLWFDRQGKQQGKWGKRRSYYHIALSPDGRQAAASSPELDLALGSTDIWLSEFARETNTRFTFGRGNNTMPVWSPDGRQIIFGSNRDGGVYNLYLKGADGIRDEEILLKSNYSKLPTSWSKDGRFLLITAFDQKTKADLRLISLEGDHKEIQILNKEFNEFDGRFSPDMRWIAYTSDESGSYEIYVRGFSPPGGKQSGTVGMWQVSTSGGTGARWRKDGKELYYRALDGTVMVVEVGAGPAFQAGPPQPLFQTPPMPTFGNLPFCSWDVTRDGNSFLINTLRTGATQAPFIIILNWQAGLKK